MRIVGPEKAAIRLTPRHTPSGAGEAEATETETRALITVGPVTPSERAPFTSRRPAAAFVAQLIATQMQAPQTRARRRAEPEEAIAVYRSMTKPVPQRRQAFGKSA